MKNNDLDEKINKVICDNKIFNVLIDRIEILNRIIEEQEKNLEYVKEKDATLVTSGVLMNEDNTLKDKEVLENREQLYKNEILQLKLEIENQKAERENIEKISNLEREQHQKLTREITIIKERYLCVEKTIVVFEKYKNMPFEIKNFFDGIISEESFEAFLYSVTTEDKLLRLYNKIKDIVMQNQEKVIINGQFDEKFIDLAVVFEFYYDNLKYVYGEIDRKRLELNVGDSYDDEQCVRIGAADGKIKSILLQGYIMENTIKTRSIVLIKAE